MTRPFYTRILVYRMRRSEHHPTKTDVQPRSGTSPSISTSYVDLEQCNMYTYRPMNINVPRQVDLTPYLNAVYDEYDNYMYLPIPKCNSIPCTSVWYVHIEPVLCLLDPTGQGTTVYNCISQLHYEMAQGIPIIEHKIAAIQRVSSTSSSNIHRMNMTTSSDTYVHVYGQGSVRIPILYISISFLSIFNNPYCNIYHTNNTPTDNNINGIYELMEYMYTIRDIEHNRMTNSYMLYITYDMKTLGNASFCLFSDLTTHRCISYVYDNDGLIPNGDQCIHKALWGISPYIQNIHGSTDAVNAYSKCTHEVTSRICAPKCRLYEHLCLMVYKPPQGVLGANAPVGILLIYICKQDFMIRGLFMEHASRNYRANTNEYSCLRLYTKNQCIKCLTLKLKLVSISKCCNHPLARIIATNVMICSQTTLNLHERYNQNIKLELSWL